MTAGSVFGLAGVGAASEASSACLAPSNCSATPGCAGVPTRTACENGSAMPASGTGMGFAQPAGVVLMTAPVTTVWMVLAAQPMPADQAAKPACDETSPPWIALRPPSRLAVGASLTEPMP